MKARLWSTVEVVLDPCRHAYGLHYVFVINTIQGSGLSGERYHSVPAETGTKEGKRLLSSCRWERRTKFLQLWAGRVSVGISAATSPLQGSSLPWGCELSQNLEQSPLPLQG